MSYRVEPHHKYAVMRQSSNESYPYRVAPAASRLAGESSVMALAQATADSYRNEGATVAIDQRYETFQTVYVTPQGGARFSINFYLLQEG